MRRTTPLAMTDQNDPPRLGESDDLPREIYQELRTLAHRHLRALRPGETLNTTALVHEAYIKLSSSPSAEWTTRAHFMAIASKSMRHIIVDAVRHRMAEKRGGGVGHDRLGDVDVAAPEQVNLVDLNDSLQRMEEAEPRLAKIVEQHFFGGMTFKEIAQALDVSERTIRREWRKARIWLYQDMKDDGA